MCCLACTVSNGGFLFQHYFDCNARVEDFKAYKNALRVGADGKKVLDLRVEAKLMKKYKAGFVFWLISTAGAKGYQQMFYLIFVLEYKGLSRSGIEMLHRLQVSLSLRTFDSYRKAALAKVDEANRYATSDFKSNTFTHLIGRF